MCDFRPDTERVQDQDRGWKLRANTWSYRQGEFLSTTMKPSHFSKSFMIHRTNLSRATSSGSGSSWFPDPSDTARQALPTTDQIVPRSALLTPETQAPLEHRKTHRRSSHSSSQSSQKNVSSLQDSSKEAPSFLQMTLFLATKSPSGLRRVFAILTGWSTTVHCVAKTIT